MAYQPLLVIRKANPLFTYILNIYDLVGLGFMVNQPLFVIQSQILFLQKY